MHILMLAAEVVGLIMLGLLALVGLLTAVVAVLVACVGGAPDARYDEQISKG
jgi:hypothetical protein